MKGANNSERLQTYTQAHAPHNIYEAAVSIKSAFTLSTRVIYHCHFSHFAPKAAYVCILYINTPGKPVFMLNQKILTYY